MKFYLSLVLVLASTAAFQFCAFAQQDDLPQTISIDSLQTEIATDTLLSPITDTLASKQKKSDIDTVVYASGTDSLFFFVKEKKMSIYGEGKINYRQSEIKSANIFLDFNKFEIEAIGVPSDTSEAEFVGLAEYPFQYLFHLLLFLCSQAEDRELFLRFLVVMQDMEHI
ncbi:MAG: Organic solvent tolerance protein OstA [Ignavibacteriaceae bacterium]|nr:Organic solvent tolerance protein OstA [Ignavibacteriaceae bacterium]